MKRFLPLALLFTTVTIAAAQTPAKPPGDEHTFTLTPTAPPTPALKYQLRFDDLNDRRSGNAATLYFDAILLMGEDTYALASKAEDALDAGDEKTFATLADSLNKPDLFEELDLAARRDQCDWDPPFREMGIRTLLPHLNSFRRLATVIRVRACRQIQLGQTADALATLRLGYEMADKIAREPLLISGLVSIGITVYLDDTLVRLINHPDSPNLYWALAELPPRKPLFRMDGDRLGTATATLPSLSRAKDGEDLSPDQWRAALTYVANLPWPDREPKKKSFAPIQASPNLLRLARDHYAQTHHVAPDQSAKIDPAVALGVYYFFQYEIAYDGFYKCRNLPTYPVQLTLMRQHAQRVTQMIADQPTNPFLLHLPYADRAVSTFARVDREVAALTTVEALRSYAAAHNNTFPAKLEDLTDTPAPINPATSLPFEYHQTTSTTATLSDSTSRIPLTYTLTLRQ